VRAVHEIIPSPERRPRSAARRAHVGAQIGAVPPRETGAAEPSFAPGRRAARMPNDAFEDTSTILDIPEQKRFFSRQPPAFWIAAALLLAALFVVAGVVGINAWREAEAARQEARRLRELAEEKAKYKLEYRSLIDDYASEQGVDPALVAAIIYNESRFDPNAVSRLGARGLMQTMEETGGGIAGKLKEEESYTSDSLFNPETNIRFGTWYLGFLSKTFGGDPVKIAAGYHAGQNAVGNRLKDPEYSSDGFLLDRIPDDYASTDQDVQRVTKSYENYNKQYYTP